MASKWHRHIYLPPPVRNTQNGFTLIELAIVLVIIGFIVGGVLVGRDLVKSAQVRATLTQIEKYQQAVNTFKGKYNGQLPGDMTAATATQFGFIARGQNEGQGDGNGILEGFNGNPFCILENEGEPVVFWVDLSTAKLIDGGFNTASEISGPATLTETSNPPLSSFFPKAKIGQGNYIYVYCGGYLSADQSQPPFTGDQMNYFGISALTSSPSGANGPNSTPALTVYQAYNMDKKIDDGLPQSGTVLALYLNNNAETTTAAWAAGGGTIGANDGYGGLEWPDPATPGTTITCYDNSNNASNVAIYSITVNNGIGMNCALSFRFQ